MSHTPHELRDAFPDSVEVLHALKVGNAHFASLADRYHDINREIHRIESEVEPATDERTEALKKQRLALLDEISALVEQAKAA
ncbi:DUF465 domain-containing protein [Chakrabartia godavariana]|jgi:uncharacterized protein YdcH (DUF465 family)|nr:DUF465 domain-containing protein [Chakrabartia godavariana]